VEAAAAKGDPRAILALDVYVASVRQWIGNYLVQLGGADALVFTAGIGENGKEIRAAVCANLEQLGIKLDAAKNAQARAQEAVISAVDSRVKIMVIPTNEELVVARETRRLLEKK
jgi:acetate kinase